MGSLHLHQPPIPAVPSRDRAELIARRCALEAAIEWHADVVERLIALADRLDGDPDLEDSGDAEETVMRLRGGAA